MPISLEEDKQHAKELLTNLGIIEHVDEEEADGARAGAVEHKGNDEKKENDEHMKQKGAPTAAGAEKQKKPASEESSGSSLQTAREATTTGALECPSFERNLALQLHSPGAIAVDGIHDVEASMSSDESNNAEPALVSAHLVPEEDSNNNDEEANTPAVEEGQVSPIPVATVVKDNSKKYLAVAAVAIIIALVVVLATTLTSRGGDNEDNEAIIIMDINTTMQPVNPLAQQESLQYGQIMAGAAAGDRFGSPLAWNNDGSILAVGARLNSDMGEESGVVRTYQARNVTKETSDGSVSTDILWGSHGNALFGQSAGDEFAYSGMAMAKSKSNGQRLAVGATSRNVTIDNGTNSTLLVNAGAVQVFDYKDGSWKQTGPVIEGLQSGDLFGRAVAMSEDGTIVAASSYESSENGFASGNVRIFLQNEETNEWDPMGQVLLGKGELDRLGRSLGMSADGMRIVAGATQWKGEGPGYVQVYDFNGTTGLWNQVGQDLVGDNDQDVFGRAVAISADGDIVACGSNLADAGGLEDSGLARMFQLDSSSGSHQWVPMGQTIVGTAEGDGLGLTVALSATGRRVAVGASQKKTSVGYVLVMDYDEGSQLWIPAATSQTNTNLTGTEHLGKFGSDVKLSADGQLLAVGVIGSDRNGDDSGEVQVFELTNW